MAFRILLIAAAVCGLIIAGCAKKPKQGSLENAAAPLVAESAAKTDSADVFKKYYRDSGESSGKNIAKTFSMKEPESFTPSFSKGGRYVVQVASMGARILADELATEFKEKGYPAYVTEITNPTAALQGTFFRVRIGAFSTIADAKSFGDNILKAANYDYWVDRKANEEGLSGKSSSDYAPQSTPPQSSYTPTPGPAPQPAPTATPAPSTGSGSGSSGSGWKSDSGANW